MNSQIWTIVVTMVVCLDTTCRFQREHCTKPGCTTFRDKRNNPWITNERQDNEICTMMNNGVNTTVDDCTSEVLNQNFEVTHSNVNNNVKKIDSIKDTDEILDIADLNDQMNVQEVPRRRKWKKQFRIVSGWARNPAPPPNPCNTGPCQNGGVCTRTGPSTYSCNCAYTGYTGTTCSIEINECQSNPCQHGTCENRINYYTCNCVAGYTGTNCQTNINECQSGPCQNGGICIDRVNRYTCNCVPGYTGTNCQTDIDECSSSPCQNQQTCVDHVNGYTCDCSMRYNGTHCEKDCRPGPADILFLIDSSDSGKHTLNASLDFIDRILDALPIGPDDFQMAAITFSKNTTLEFNFKEYKDNTSLRNAFRSVANKGRATYTDLALSLARDVIFNSSLGARPNAYKYIILLYDGMSTTRTTTINIRSSLLPSTIVRVYTIGVGEQVDHVELLQIASNPDYVFSSKNNDALYKLLEETSHSDCDDCSESAKTDILLMVDASSSNTITDFQHFLSTTGDIVRHLDVDINTDIHLSVAGFASGVQNNYGFGVFTSNNKILSTVQKITLQPAKANATEALRHAREASFLSSNGGRVDARKILVLISNAKWESHNSVITEAEKVKQSGITLMNIGIGIETDIDKFYDIASDPYHVFLVIDGDTSHLRSIASDAKYSTCATDIFSKRV